MKKLISYVFPIYNEAGNIDLLHKTISETVVAIQDTYDIEFVFVNDGSTDESLTKLLALQAQDDRIVVVNFARNFGHQIAVTAGLDHAKGDAVIIMDSDLQDPPRVSLELIAQWEQGYDVVYAQRRTRKDGLFKRVTASMFYWVLQKLADIAIPRNTGDFRLISRRVVTALAQFQEHNRFLRGMVSYVGFRQTAVAFDRDERHAGVTGYPLRKMIKFATDGILSFSWTPLKLISRLGFIFAGLSVIGIIYTIAVRVFEPASAVPGWAFTVIAILLTGGVQMMMLGVLGAYIGRIYAEAQNRPLYIIESVSTGRDAATHPKA